MSFVLWVVASVGFFWLASSLLVERSRDWAVTLSLCGTASAVLAVPVSFIAMMQQTDALDGAAVSAGLGSLLWLAYRGSGKALG